MKAISIRRPWAWLIVEGIKDVENRTWPTRYRGDVLIHAGKQIDRGVIEELRADREFQESLGANGITFPSEFPTGGIVGVAKIVDCVRESESDWFEGPYGFVLDAVGALPFFECRGKLGIFEVDYPYPVEPASASADEGIETQAHSVG